MTDDRIEQLAQVIADTQGDVSTAGCNDQRGECQRIAARAADAVLALLPGLVSNDAATRGTDV